MNKENEKELRKHLELQTKEELIEQIIILTRTYENALSTIVDKKKIIYKAIELLDSYKLGKYDYALTPDGLLELEDILRGEDNDK